MNVLLVHPDFPRHITHNDVLHGFSPPALGVNYLATILCKAGHKASVLDPLYEFFRNPAKRVVRVGNSLEKLIEAENINVVGLSATSPTRLLALDLARRVKRHDSSVVVVLGGPHATLMGERILDAAPDAIDVVVIGEGEETLPALMHALDSVADLEEVPGIAFRKDGAVVRTVDSAQIMNLDAYPFPEYQQYLDLAGSELFRTAAVVTSRGCPFHCSFCASEVLWGRRPRYRSVERVSEEIKALWEHYGVQRIIFNDDTFSVPLPRAKHLLSLLLEDGMRIEMGCTTHFEGIDDEFLQLHQQLGGSFIYFGLESGSERLRDTMNKGTPDNQAIVDICQLVKEYGIKLGMYVIFGYPTETEADVKQTAALLERIRPDEVTANIAHVHPGTHLFDIAVAQGRYNGGEWLASKEAFFPYETSAARLRQLRDVCGWFEKRFGQPRYKGGFCRDVGSANG